MSLASAIGWRKSPPPKRCYDRVIIDCPPGLTDTSDQIFGRLTVVVPVIPAVLSRRALDVIKDHLQEKKGRSSYSRQFSRWSTGAVISTFGSSRSIRLARNSHGERL